MQCPFCHDPLDTAHLYCPKCGKTLSKSTINASPKRYRWFKFFGTLLFTLILVILWKWPSSEELVASVKGQLQALRAERITEAYFEYASKDFQGAVPLTTFRELVKSYPALLNNENILVLEEKIGDNSALLKTMLTSSDNTKIPVEYELVKENRKWKIANILLTNLETSNSTGNVRVDWLQPIDLQLRHFRQRDYQLAYEESTSPDFRKATSLEDFTAFVNQNQILSTHTDVSVKSQTLKNDEAEITIILNPEHEAVIVYYMLKKEAGEWRIWGMTINPTYSEAVMSLINNPMSIRRPVEAQLQHLRNNDISKAYYNYTSHEFKDNTPLDEFRKFVASYPILINYEAAEFKEPLIVDKTSGYLEASLYGKNLMTTLEYNIGIEDEQWKIWGLRILQQQRISNPETSLTTPLTDTTLPADFEPLMSMPTIGKAPSSSLTPTSASTLEFTKMEVGTGLNLQGEIVNPSPMLRSPTGDLYINLIVNNGIAHAKIELQLEHQESQSKLPKVSTTLQQEGLSRLSFAFTAPAHGWPQGHYIIRAISSTGSKRDFTFVIE